MKEGCDLMEHMNTFNRMISDLLRLDVKFNDEDRSLLLLNSLSHSYEHFVTILLYEKKTLSFEEVTQDIISNAARRKPNKGDSHAEGLLVKEGSHNRGKSKDRGRSRRNNSKSKSESKKDSKCFHCGKKWRGKKDCRHYKASRDGKNKAGDKSESSDLASVASEKEVELLSASQDIDECITGNYTCRVGVCKNKEGSYDCTANMHIIMVILGNPSNC
ncbi:hypothetical protein MRB53_000713 [Persea americana]|uniref:Uncharacterized protein n=1 Tax=Persea americana TaxID=3435 RepID=A0ACC2MQK2_PERAE|nr:hypothetical protein MRB53_000713 [Persea americana]